MSKRTDRRERRLADAGNGRIGRVVCGELRRAAVEALENRRLLAANLVISEFLASNDDNIEDSFLNHTDWIEIHNAGDATANLNDYFLTDDGGNPNKWRFPVQNLDAGDSIVVFASERNLTVPGQELHTNFKLDAGGEYLGLIRAADDTIQFEYALTYPVQSTDISYGLSDWNNPGSARIYFSVPTPGAANAASVVTPTLTPSQTFFGSMQVAISTPTPGATIYYTTDNTAPTTASTVYSGPINLTGSAIVRAIATAPSYVDSPVSSQSYTAVDGTVNTFQSNLPIVVLESFNQTFADQNYVNASATFINTSLDGYADMLDPVNFSGRVGLRYRGSTSYSNYPKKPFAVEVRDESNDDKNASILGMPADSDWVLYSPWTERSLMNNALAMDWSRQMGHYASRVRFVEVYLNNDADTAVNYADDYLGVYILMEKPKLGDKRVDIAKVLPTATTEPDITGGYFFKKDRWESSKSPPEIKIDTVGGAEVDWQRFVMVQPDEFDITSPQVTYLTNYLNELDTVMQGPNFADPVNGYAKYLDVDSWVDFYLMAEFTKSVDSFWLSTYFYKPKGGKIFMGPNWDFNLAFGQANYRNGASAAGYNHDSLTTLSGFGDQYGYFKRLFDDPNFQVKVADRWQELRKTVFDTSKMQAEMDAYVGLLTDNNGNYPVGPGAPVQTSNNAAVRNFKRWPVLGVYSTTNSYFDPQGRWIEDVNMMKSWIKARAEWFDTQFVPAPVLAPGGGSFGAPTNVTMTPKQHAAPVDTVLLAPGAAARAHIPTANITGWQSPSYVVPGAWLTGTTGIGYDGSTTPVNFNPLVGLNVSAMQNVRTSVFIRVQFNVANPATVGSLILKMKYDDGFFAWVNGVRVIEGNAPENNNPVYTTAAVSSRVDADALNDVEYDISAVKPLLVAGTNVLAIQGMNNVVASSDMIMMPEIVSRTYATSNAGTVYFTTDGSDPRAQGGGVAGSAVQYTAPVPISTSTRIRARTLNAGVWSGEADEIYNFGLSKLRVTEIMYNPPAPPVGSPYPTQDFEFIEVKNTDTSSLNLTGYTFSNGISFSFPGTALAAGQYGVIVKNQAAFESRYGTGLNILGVYTGSLDNAGETVAITDGFAQVVQSFTYDDAWYPTTDGGGYSLVIVDANGVLTNWGLQAGWRASYEINGKPAQIDTDTTPPTFSSATFVPATKQVQLTFSENVTLGAGLSVTEIITTTPITPAGSSASGNVVTVTLPAGAVKGIYRVIIPAGGVSDPFANPIATSTTYTFLYVSAGQTLVVPVSSPTHVVDQLAIDSTGKLDLKDNSLVLRSGDVGSWNGSAYTGVTGQVASGRGDGSWNGNGITSSLADGSGYTGIGVASAAELFGLTGNQTGSWEGQTVGATSVLIKYTYGGDANLSGNVDVDDYGQIDFNSSIGGVMGGFFNGDFDFSGIQDVDDYGIIDFVIGIQGPPL